MACRRDSSLQISGPRAELDQIFHSTGLQVVGLQVCRAKKARRLQGENFYMISEPADAKGRGGCELWVAKELQAKRAHVAFGTGAAASESGTPQVQVLCFGLPCTSRMCWRAGKTFLVAALQICGAGVCGGHGGARDGV